MNHQLCPAGMWMISGEFGEDLNTCDPLITMSPASQMARQKFLHADWACFHSMPLVIVNAINNPSIEGFKPKFSRRSFVWSQNNFDCGKRWRGEKENTILRPSSHEASYKIWSCGRLQWLQNLPLPTGDWIRRSHNQEPPWTLAKRQYYLSKYLSKNVAAM